MNDEQVMKALGQMPGGWAFRWCSGGICGCLGCANNSGGLVAEGVTEEQWARCLRQLAESVTRRLTP